MYAGVGIADTSFKCPFLIHSMISILRGYAEYRVLWVSVSADDGYITSAVPQILIPCFY
jgi:hypothetical protein